MRLLTMLIALTISSNLLAVTKQCQYTIDLLVASATLKGQVSMSSVRVDSNLEESINSLKNDLVAKCGDGEGIPEQEEESDPTLPEIPVVRLK